MNTKMAVAAMPGITTGITTRTSIWSVPQPSMRAASSNSRGTSRMNVAISHMPSGRFRVACARGHDRNIGAAGEEEHRHCVMQRALCGGLHPFAPLLEPRASGLPVPLATAGGYFCEGPDADAAQGLARGRT